MTFKLHYVWQNQMVLCFTKYTTKIYNKATIYANELILALFSPFDIKCKILTLMWKTSGILFLGHLGGWVFHIFPRLHLIMCACVFGRVEPLLLFRVFVDHVTIFNSSSMQRLRWSLLLETVVDSCYIELCLKCDRAPRSDSEMHRSI